MNPSQFVDTRFVDFPRENPFLTNVRQRYGLPLETPVAESLVSIQVRLPQASPLLWDRATSMPRTPHRRKMLRAVSLTLQQTLRAWLPYLWLSVPANWEDRDLLWPLMIYASSRTFKPISRQTYAFDRLCPDTIPALLRSSLPRLKAWVPNLLAVTHHHPDSRDEFHLRQLIHVIKDNAFDAQPLLRLLMHEEKLITAFMDLADGHSHRNDVRRFGRELYRHLSRFYRNADFSFLSPLLMMEIENTLAVYLLDREILEAELTLNTPPPGTRAERLPRPAFLYRQPNRVPSVQSK